jgi:hypothetical protein
MYCTRNTHPPNNSWRRGIFRCCAQDTSSCYAEGRPPSLDDRPTRRPVLGEVMGARFWRLGLGKGHATEEPRAHAWWIGAAVV